eukprot:1387001-Prymnesium_polylepis.1
MPSLPIGMNRTREANRSEIGYGKSWVKSGQCPYSAVKGCQRSRQAWVATMEPGADSAALAVNFDTVGQSTSEAATRVRIYETRNPTSEPIISSIELYEDADVNLASRLPPSAAANSLYTWAGVDSTACGDWFELELPALNAPVSQMIDSVQLCGEPLRPPPPPPPAPPESLWACGQRRCLQLG